jgi:hypothetical protein
VKTPAILQAFKQEILATGAELLQADDPVAIGGHRLIGRLTSNGTGVVYLARDRGTGLVTIRTAHTGTTEPEPVRARLRAEATCARRLPSSCAAPLLHDGTDETPPYLVSGYLEGPSLERVVDITGPLPPAMVVTLAADLARVLAAVHDAGVVHGNLTPTNIVLTKDGPRVIDFGVAQEISTSGEPAEIGAVADNPGWLAPELLTGGPPGPACDVFGFGCLVAYAATGHSPYGEGTAAPARFQPLGTGPLDEPLRLLVDASAAEDPAARPTAADLTARLDALHAHTPVPVPVSRTGGPPAVEDGAAAVVPVVPAVRRLRPRRVRARAAVSVFVALAGLLIAVPTATEHTPGPPPEAPRPSAPPAKRHRAPASNTAAMSAYDMPASTIARTARPRTGSRAPRSVIWMSCTGARYGWCTMSGPKGDGSSPGSPIWRITWPSGG